MDVSSNEPEWKNDSADATAVKPGLICSKCHGKDHESNTCKEKRLKKLWPGQFVFRGTIRTPDGSTIEMEMPLGERGKTILAELVQACGEAAGGGKTRRVCTIARCDLTRIVYLLQKHPTRKRRRSRSLSRPPNRLEQPSGLLAFVDS